MKHSAEQPEQFTGTRDQDYDLISVLYHALQSCETVAVYAEDAEQAGDDQLLELFEDILEEDRRRIQRCKQILRQRMENVIPGNF